MIELRPINQADAFGFIREHHRHHNVPVGGLWWQAVHDDNGAICGVAVTGRPVARPLDDGLTAEVTRLCTNGAANACSMLYAAARRVAVDKGFRRGLTYILASEDGASLRAAGWRLLWEVKGRSWNCPSRPRVDKHPTEDKKAYGWGAWPILTVENEATL
ncbi:MAG TPA: XF1762 family protein [Sphingomicrobium sp.]|nr:XF1762 family protein [Sphingomicrobium sp.]